jgi:CopA family copper-resistance protein
MPGGRHTNVNRGRSLQRSAALGGALAFQALLPAWARSGPSNDLNGLKALSGTRFDLDVAHARPAIDGEQGKGILVNGHLPAPRLRWREGDEIRLHGTNHLKMYTSTHWHGILLPVQLDGVPGVTFPGIKPGETFTCEFPVRQAGTYWYHGHSGLQEQLGHCGPIVTEPRDPDPVACDREYVIVLSDWAFEDPHRVFAKLNKVSDTCNFQQRTVSDFLEDVRDQGFSRTLAERMVWGSMRMNPNDIADVTAATCASGGSRPRAHTGLTTGVSKRPKCQALYSHAIGPFWDVQAGIRGDSGFHSRRRRR